MLIQAGQLLTIVTGEYSDTCHCGPLRVLRDLDQAAVAEEFRAQWKPQDICDVQPGPDEFLPWLVRAGYVEDVPGAVEWHVGSYGLFEPGTA